MSDAITMLAFWTATSVVVFAYAIYPLLVWLLSKLRPIIHSTRIQSELDAPRVSLLIAAHNEAQCIAARIRNALALEYPRERIEIVVASDGSEDSTNDIVRSFATDGVRLLDFRLRRGKAAVLNDAMTAVRGDIIVLSDANTNFEPEAIRQLDALVFGRECRRRVRKTVVDGCPHWPQCGRTLLAL